MLRKLIFLVVVFGWALAHRASADLVGFWEFEDADGGVIKDSSGNGYNGMIVGGAEVVADLVRGQVLRNVAGGSVDLFNVPNPVPGFAANSSITLAAWVKPEAIPLTNWDYVIQLGRNGDNPIVSLGVTPDGRIASYTESDQPGGNLDQVNVFSGAVEGGNTVFESWHHIAVVYDRATDTATTYIDGVADATTDISLLQDDYAFTWTSAFLGADQGDGRVYVGLMDDVAVFDHALTEAEIQKIMQGLNLELAKQPQPEVAVVDVLRDVTLEWRQGEFAVKHDVYLGAVFDDVYGAGTDSNLLVGEGLTASSYDAGILDFGQTYYWRVDEVNGAPDNTVFKGDVWSFTVEPYSIQIPGVDITVTASSSSNEFSTPDKTIDGSGLDENDMHTIGSQDMWFTASVDLDPWIEYEFEDVKKLDIMTVWNSNSAAEMAIGWGVKDVEIQYSVDGETWDVLADATQLSRAPGLPTYDQPDEIAFNGVAAKVVRLNIQSNWGGILMSYGLSEVQFNMIPAAARTPEPVSGSMDVLPNATLTWRAGREAAQHRIYVGIDQNEVADGMAPSSTSSTNSLDLGSLDLELGQAYYWRVDEVNEAEAVSVWAGPVWSFTTLTSLIVDDFESYGNVSPDRPFQAWLDGFGYSADEFFPAGYGGNGTGAGIGHDIWSLSSPYYDGDIMETSNTLPGSGQSMPFYYGNSGGVASETQHTFAVPQDWTVGGVKTLSIPFSGQAGNTGTLYAKINGVKVTYPHDPANLALGGWIAFNIDLSSMNVQNVTELAIGVDGSNASGMLLIDDITLHSEAGKIITPEDPGTNGLVASYSFEGNANDVSGNGNNGTVNGGAQFVAGHDGSALDCDGVDDYVSTGKVASDLGIGGNSARTISVWVFTRGFNNGGIYDVGARVNAQDFCLRTLGNDNEWRIQYWGGDSDFTLDSMNKWVHFTHVHDGVNTKIYANGVLFVDWAKTIDTTDTNPFQIGLYGWPGNYFDGLIDEVRVYNRALSEGEALSLAGATAPIDKPF